MIGVRQSLNAHHPYLNPPGTQLSSCAQCRMPPVRARRTSADYDHHYHPNAIQNRLLRSTRHAQSLFAEPGPHPTFPPHSCRGSHRPPIQTHPSIIQSPLHRSTSSHPRSSQLTLPSGSRVSEALSNTVLSEAPRPLASIAYNSEPQLEAACSEVITKFEEATGTTLNDVQRVAKLKELKRVNKILDLFVIEAEPEDFSPVRSDVLLTSIFSR